MRVIRKHPGQTWEIADVENTLKAFQAEVGGNIETLTVLEDCTIVINEEGRLIGLPENVDFCGIPLCGTVLLVGIDGEEFCDVPVSALELVANKQMFRGIKKGR